MRAEAGAVHPLMRDLQYVDYQADPQQARTLRSTALRQERLLPLAAALDARPGTDARDLARKARQVVTTRT